jgi:hypothetical protein
MNRLSLAVLVFVHTVVGACLYVLLIELVFGYEMHPFSPQWSWALQFEHGELQEEHYIHAVGVALAALPIALELALLRAPKVHAILLGIGILATCPYITTPQLPYAEEQTWLLRYSVELEAVRILAAPSLLYLLVFPIVKYLRRARQNAI